MKHLSLLIGICREYLAACCEDESANFQMSAPGGRSSSNKNAMVAVPRIPRPLGRGSAGRLVFITPLATCILFAVFAVPALAQTSAEVEASASVDASLTPPSPKPLDILKARAQQIKSNVQNARADWQAGATGTAQARNASTSIQMKFRALIRLHVGLIRERFTNVIVFFDRLMARVDSRIEKMKTAGVNMSAVESLQVEAEAAINVAEADIAKVRAYIEGVTDEDDRTTVKAELEAKIKTARESIRKAHEAIRKVVRALVDLAKQNRVNATTTVEVDAGASVGTSTNQ